MQDAWDQILDFVQWYPSPHNSQPIKVRLSGDTMEMFYDMTLGLPAESYGVPFGSVCAGVFIECVSIAAHHLGYEVKEHLEYTVMDFSSQVTLHPLGRITLSRDSEKPPKDLDANLMLQRRTSRSQYENRIVEEAVLTEVEKEAVRFGHVLSTTTDEDLVKSVIAVNQRTLFYDLSKPAVRHEIQGYLRYNEREATSKGDGLSAVCLDMPGMLMKIVMGNYWLWKVPVVGSIIRTVYLNSMRGVAQVAWIKGPFTNQKQYTDAGRLVIRMWLILTKHGVRIHPFGSVITNPQAHAEFVKTIGEHEDHNMVWMLFRLGYSPEPPRSHRRSKEEMVLSS